MGNSVPHCACPIKGDQVWVLGSLRAYEMSSTEQNPCDFGQRPTGEGQSFPGVHKFQMRMSD